MSLRSRPNHSKNYSAVHKLQSLNYVPWQRSKQKTKTFTLPPVRPAGSHSKSKMKTVMKAQPASHSKSTTLVTSQPKHLQEPQRKEKSNPGKMQAKVRLLRSMVLPLHHRLALKFYSVSASPGSRMCENWRLLVPTPAMWALWIWDLKLGISHKMMLKNRRATLQELHQHEHFLTTLNQELISAIQDMEDSSAVNVRAMLQQQDILSTIIDILEYSNKKRLQQLQSELQEWEEKEESKMSRLEQQVEQLNATIKKTHEEVSFLSTYMDHEYPVKSVQIANLGRQLQQLKDSQQDELDELSEMRKKVLESLCDKMQKKKKKILKFLVVKTQQPHEEALVQKSRDSEDMRRCVKRFREFIGQFEEEMPILKAEVEELQAQMQEPREIIFQDVLLRRPKCTPDMDVILNIPVEEQLPF
ncbi:uncharacterized protein C20orf96 homolog isoform X2 [Tupaia chinensis]|uniref:uncharacterized protein C20orf96 homolog isoform X2 n=1 Tax=Tupaia chinensis TaxID=246437 RepID=UPI000FFC2D33|nr:uncharacterized protein C20orf96 homolog isoform X2 [Tupaia chinensis]